MSVIAKHLEVTEVVTPTFVINTPEVINFVSESNTLVNEEVRKKWLTCDVSLSFEFNNNQLYESIRSKIIEDWDESRLYVNFLSKKLVYRLHGFFNFKIADE